MIGNPLLRETSSEVTFSSEVTVFDTPFAIILQDLKDTLTHLQKAKKIGRALAAPQIGHMKRVIYMQIPIYMQISMQNHMQTPQNHMQTPMQNHMQTPQNHMQTPMQNHMQIPARTLVMVNPKITEKSKELIEVWDSCYSFDVAFFVKIKRHKKIKVEYQDEHGRFISEEFVDDLSELFQHEIDHLDGILATDYLKDNKNIILRDEWEKRYK
jgi:peptide deformylase